MSENESSPPKTEIGLGGAALTPDFYAYWYLLRDRWKLIASCVLVGGALAAAYILNTPRTYTAQSVVQVEQQKRNVANIREISPEDFKSTEALKTVEQALTSSSVLLAVARANHLFEDPDFVGKDQRQLAEPQMVSILSSAITAKLRRGTRLVDVVVDDIDPERAVRLAKSVVVEYVAAGSKMESMVSGGASEYLAKQADDLRTKLQKAEMALQEYRSKYNAVSLEAKQDTINARLAQLNKAVTDAEGTRIKFESAVKAIKEGKTKKGSELLEIAAVAGLDEIINIKKDIKNKETEIANLKQRYLELHPKMIAAQGEIKKLNDNLQAAAVKAATVIEKSYRAAVEDEQTLKKSLQEQEKAALELSRISVPYSALQREVDANNTLFNTVLARMKETQLDEGIQNANIRVIQEPVRPYKPTKPRRFRILAAALVGGFVIGVGIVIGLDLVDSSFRSVDQAENMLGVPVLGAVPSADKTKGQHRLELIEAPATLTAEAVRGFRTAVALLANHGPINVVLFTSATAGEGKSYCAANYAVALAQQGLKTLLIDADLRRPGLNAIFPEAADSPGVAGFLRGEDSLEAACRPSTVPVLSLMPAGKDKAPNPAELLSSGRFKDLIEQAAGKFERVVIDTAPVNAVSDTLLFASLAPVICLVVRAGRTPRRAVLRAVQVLARANAKPAGVVLNRLRTGRGANYDYYSEGSYASTGVYGH